MTASKKMASSLWRSTRNNFQGRKQSKDRKNKMKMMSVFKKWEKMF